MNNNLIEITTPIQHKIGTRRFICTRTGAHYGSYASGYVRRKVSPHTKYSRFYQLNKTFKTFPAVSNKVSRELLITESDRLELINKRSQEFQKNIMNNTEDYQQKSNVTQNNTEVKGSFSFETKGNNMRTIRSRSYTGARKNLKWPSYIVQVVHSSMMLNETPDVIASRLDQMLTDVPEHRFNFKSQKEKIEAIHNVMQHLQSRARQSVDRMIDHIDNVDRSRG